MKRHIKYIVVHSTATFDPKVSQYYGDFHYVVERSGEIKRIQPETTVVKNVAAADNEAIHIAYAGGRNKAGNLGDTRTPVQEEALYNKLIALTLKYPSVRIVGHNEFEASSGCPGFNVKDWLRAYEPEITIA
ncbi:N-acetylmuramoyl-L-alanine amidase [Flavisolibacter nicotianae]|uniref:N-acetylmuramoyl-L-alanine amidase n=1 Tax=Flavisolibacter nicotianae TaxID=2364882 RepID=UPI000EB1012A|nr:N-acetylmuramoyl-L-alanine amidase [Flavisolibacter nicotianae]